MKLLFISNIAGKKIGNFSMSSIKAAKALGIEFHIAANWNKSSLDEIKEEEEKYGIKIHNINLARNPFNPINIKAYKEILRLVKSEKIDIIHCNTPVGGVLGRICGKVANVSKIIYTAHGFHFFKGAPILNWLVYYPSEIILSYFTDVLVTINKEDYNLAKKKMKSKKISYIPGVGMDINRFVDITVDKEKKLYEIDIPVDSLILLSVGELNKNKNHEVIIKALSKLSNPKIHYIIAGKGELEQYLKEVANSLGIGNNIHILGFRNDIGELCKIADIFCFPSKREGLGLAAIEAMSVGLPIITSNVHGINDYSQNGITGFSCSPSAVDEFVKAIDTLSKDEMLRRKMGEYNIELVRKFDIEFVEKEISKIYKEVLNG